MKQPRDPLKKSKKCRTCGTAIYNHLYNCANCWEVESRLVSYLRSERGREFIKNKLKESNEKA